MYQGNWYTGKCTHKVLPFILLHQLLFSTSFPYLFRVTSSVQSLIYHYLIVTLWCCLFPVPSPSLSFIPLLSPFLFMSFLYPLPLSSFNSYPFPYKVGYEVHICSLIHTQTHTHTKIHTHAYTQINTCRKRETDREREWGTIQHAESRRGIKKVKIQSQNSI